MSLGYQNIERRAYPRQSLHEHAYLNNANRDFLGTVKDYSLGGIFIRSKRTVSVGEVLSFLFARPENGGQVTPETAWVVRERTDGFALKFIQTEAENPA